MRLSYPLVVSALLLAGCSEPTPLSTSDVFGFWTITSINDAALPALTESGDTVIDAFVYVGGTSGSSGGELNYCLGHPDGRRSAGGAGIRWQTADATRLVLAYAPSFDYTGGTGTVDTAFVSGETMRLRPKIADPDLGASRWKLIRVSDDPNTLPGGRCDSQVPR